MPPAPDRKGAQLHLKSLRVHAKVALCLATPGGRAAPADMKAAVAAALPFALDQEDPTSFEDFAKSRSVTALRFAIPGVRAFPADFTTATAAALSSSFAVGYEAQLHQKTLQYQTLSWPLLCDSKWPRAETRFCDLDGLFPKLRYTQFFSAVRCCTRSRVTNFTASTFSSGN